MIHARSGKELPMHHNWPSCTPSDEIVVVFKILFKGIDKNELNKSSGGFQFTRTRFTTHLVYLGCVQSKRTLTLTSGKSMAMLFLTCSKVVMPIKLLAPTISHMLSSSLYSHVLIDEYRPPGTHWYTVVHKQFKKRETRPLVVIGTQWYTNNLKKKKRKIF